MLVTIDKRGSINLPVSLRRQLGIRQGSNLELSAAPGGSIQSGLGIERITNDPSAWSARADRKYRISFEPTVLLPSGSPDWRSRITLLRIIDHDDLYKTLR